MIILISGYLGSGKTQCAKSFTSKNTTILEMDAYYKRMKQFRLPADFGTIIDPAFITTYHRAKTSLYVGNRIVVTGPFNKMNQLNKYAKLAKEFNRKLIFIRLEKQENIVSPFIIEKNDLYIHDFNLLTLEEVKNYLNFLNIRNKVYKVNWLTKEKKAIF